MDRTITVKVEISDHQDDYHNRRVATRTLRLQTEDYPFDVEGTVRAVGDSAVEAAKELVGGVPTRPQEGGR